MHRFWRPKRAYNLATPMRAGLWRHRCLHIAGVGGQDTQNVCWRPPYHDKRLHLQGSAVGSGLTQQQLRLRMLLREPSSRLLHLASPRRHSPGGEPLNTPGAVCSATHCISPTATACIGCLSMLCATHEMGTTLCYPCGPWKQYALVCHGSCHMLCQGCMCCCQSSLAARAMTYVEGCSAVLVLLRSSVSLRKSVHAQVPQSWRLHMELSWGPFRMHC